MWCLWSALDIFLHGIVMVYLKVTHLSFIDRKKLTFLWLFHYLAVCFQVFINVWYICVIYVWIWIDVRNPNMLLSLKCMIFWRWYCSLKTANICQLKKNEQLSGHFAPCRSLAMLKLIFMCSVISQLLWYISNNFGI